MAIKDVCDSSFGRRTAAWLGLGSRPLFDQWCEPVEWAGDGADRRIGDASVKRGLTRLAEALVRQGAHEEALGAAREGLQTLERTGHRQWEAQVHRLEGISLSGLNRLEKGQIALKEALRVARHQQAKSYELRAATSLARLWGEQGRRPAARELLAPVYGWFTEGFDTADLKEAKALLDELT